MEKYLARRVDSVLAQTYTNLEVIVVDDGSNDTSGKICDAYAAKDARVKVIHQKNSGVSAARNAGLAASTGEYIGFVDPDDWIEPVMYQTMLIGMRDQGAEVSMCSVQDVQENGGVTPSKPTRCGYLRRVVSAKLCQNSANPTPF